MGQVDIYLVAIIVIVLLSVGLPVALRGRDGIHDLIQSISGFGTLAIAVLGGVFISEEIEDRRNARITAAWDLLNSSRSLVEGDFLRLLENPELRVLRLLSMNGKCRTLLLNGELPSLEETPEPSNYCDFRNDFDDLRDKSKGRVFEALLFATTSQSYGQRSALETLAKEDVPMPGLVLSGYNLDGAQLSGAILTNADLQRASLRGSNLTNADFSNSDLLGVELEGAILDGTKLLGASLVGVRLEHARLAGQDMTSIDLSFSSIVDSDFSFSNVSGSYISGNSNFENSRITGSNFLGASLSSSDFEDATIIDSNFSETSLTCSNLTNVEFRRVDLTGSDIGCASVSGADFSEAKGVVELFRSSQSYNRQPSISYSSDNPPILPEGLDLPDSRGCDCDK